jgi:hypothetical protein
MRLALLISRRIQSVKFIASLSKMDTIQLFDVNDLPNSSFSLFLGKRGSGKSVLAESLVKQLYEAGKIDLAFLYSGTGAGFSIIKKESRFDNLDTLPTVIKNMRRMNAFNEVANNADKIKMRMMLVIDDFACDMKSKSFEIFKELSVNGRHVAYSPLALHVVVLCQALTALPRIVRLNADLLVVNAISSVIESKLILDEYLYVLDGSTAGKRQARQLYTDIVTSAPFTFLAIEAFRPNVRQFSDFLKIFRAPNPDE